MNLINQILPLLFSLTGFIFGLILSLIAPEEIKPGKKYFLLLKRILFLAIIVLINLCFINIYPYLYLAIFTVFALTLFIIQFRNKTPYLEIANYSIFIIPYFLNQNPTFHLILLALIFLYGFPTGTLSRKKLIKNIDFLTK